MRTDEQWFRPGDKVMRVQSGSVPGTYPGVVPAYPQMGTVYCVEDFWEGPEFNVVMLVGFGGWKYMNGMKVGWRAIYFRKVDEIKLCIAAVKTEQSHVRASAELFG